MSFSVERPATGVMRLSMGTAFLSEDAWQVHDLLERIEASERLVLDFRRVRDCADFALSLLARDLLAKSARVEVVGMTQHQERVLSYFGVAPSSPRAFGDADPI